MKIKLKYFASLRESRGLDEEQVETNLDSPLALYQSLKKEHGFLVDSARIKVAINGKYERMDAPISESDEIVFIPPVSGG